MMVPAKKAVDTIAPCHPVKQSQPVAVCEDMHRVI